VPALVAFVAVVGVGGLATGCASTNAQAEIAGIPPEPLFGDDADEGDQEGDAARAAAFDPANVWIEQPTIGEIGVSWPPRQTVLELDVDPAIATPATVVTLRVDEMSLWQGPWAETVHVALPEGAHRVSVAMVAPGVVVGQRLALVETRVKCRQRVTAWNDNGKLRLQHDDECSPVGARPLAATR
jgi:hypothetical protein